MPNIQKVPVTGEILERESGGRIVAISFNETWGLRYELGQIVYSNGRMWFPHGHLGIITELRAPNTPGCTSNLLGVWFLGAHQINWMKPKDLLPQNNQGITKQEFVQVHVAQQES